MPRELFDDVILSAVAAKLEAVKPPLPTYSVTAAIKKLETQIRKLQRDGHTVQAIARILNDAGISAKPETVSAALKKPKKKAKVSPVDVTSEVQKAAEAIDVLPAKGLRKGKAA
jgi:hypothetical protein